METNEKLRKYCVKEPLLRIIGSDKARITFLVKKAILTYVLKN